jgi:hypothetical protein
LQRGASLRIIHSMSFRDDHDAALARAEGLEREVASLRAQLDTRTAELAQARDANAVLTRELAGQRPQPRPRERTPRQPVSWGIIALIAFGILAFGAAYYTGSDDRRDARFLEVRRNELDLREQRIDAIERALEAERGRPLPYLP